MILRSKGTSLDSDSEGARRGRVVTQPERRPAHPPPQSVRDPFAKVDMGDRQAVPALGSCGEPLSGHGRCFGRLGVPVLTPGEPHLPLARRRRILLPWLVPAFVIGLSDTAWIAATRDGRPPPWYLYALIPSCLSLIVGVCRLAREERRHQ